MDRLAVRLARLWLDGVDAWLDHLHPHWRWLDRLSRYWGNPLCAAYMVAWGGSFGGWLRRRVGYYPGDQFYSSRWIPQSRRARAVVATDMGDEVQGVRGSAPR